MTGSSSLQGYELALMLVVGLGLGAGLGFIIAPLSIERLCHPASRGVLVSIGVVCLTAGLVAGYPLYLLKRQEAEG